MATRHQARQAVVSLLYAYEMGTDSKEFLEEFLEDKKIRNERKTQVVETFNKILEKKDDIDNVFKQHLKDEDISKVGLVERSIIRLGIFEIKFADTDKAVVINEAIELAKELASDTSPRFVNAILDKVSK
ncbi:transcription antitermination protein [Campylobacter pinnipediorum subsp. caledonicus]|uniref:Transcription antitermination protein NusB n=1 Tax=Campylobacter pinnipediorum subsp. caledonicus TaxID=1874362 RepID=A0A1S6U5G4_9BACT|nr:transcription antitermination factor NusB [Campylobacter pinnipediorum]AQW85330.1 transcription antitermination protein [Campylobacter pinnipediorum subsp. caledonicus]AQW86939.1 transcription antitermination protein [Campylobacter pinnipediorum subsp. caledonicus]